MTQRLQKKHDVRHGESWSASFGHLRAALGRSATATTFVISMSSRHDSTSTGDWTRDSAVGRREHEPEGGAPVLRSRAGSGRCVSSVDRRGRPRDGPEGQLPRRGGGGAGPRRRARDPGDARAAHRGGRGRGDDAHGGGDDRVRRGGSQGPRRTSGIAVSPAAPQLAAAGAALDRFMAITPKSSPCHAATATCARSRCRSAESAR